MTLTLILWILIALMAGSIVLDVETTLAVVKKPGGFETNPIMAWLLKLASNTRFPIYCFQGAVQFGLAGLLLRLFGPLSASIMAGIAAAIHIQAGVGNWRILK